MSEFLNYAVVAVVFFVAGFFVSRANGPGTDLGDAADKVDEVYDKVEDVVEEVKEKVKK